MNKKGNSAFANNFIASYKQDRLIFFPYDLVTVNDCLSDTLEKAKSSTNSSLQTICKGNLNKIIFAHLNINSIRNKFDPSADIIKDNIDILMIPETKAGSFLPDRQFFFDGFGTPFCLDRSKNGTTLCFLLEMTFLQKLLLQMTDPLKVVM